MKGKWVHPHECIQTPQAAEQRGLVLRHEIPPTRLTRACATSTRVCRYWCCTASACKYDDDFLVAGGRFARACRTREIRHGRSAPTEARPEWMAHGAGGLRQCGRRCGEGAGGGLEKNERALGQAVGEAMCTACGRSREERGRQERIHPQQSAEQEDGTSEEVPKEER